MPDVPTSPHAKAMMNLKKNSLIIFGSVAKRKICYHDAQYNDCNMHVSYWKSAL